MSEDDRPKPEVAPVRLPVPFGRAKARGAGAFEAQVLAEGPRRGLKGGKETLEAARSTYLKTEWSGPADRRPRKGLITKTEV